MSRAAYSPARLAAWFLLVGALAAANYAARFTSTAGHGERDTLYSYSAAFSGLVFYAIFFVFVYAIAAVDKRELFALRRPVSWGGAASLCLAVVVGSVVWSFVVSQLPIENPGEEQGLVPNHWEPSHAGAYAANFVLIAIAAPLVEEVTFRGVGFGLLRHMGTWTTIVVVGVAFGLAHGLIAGLLVLIPFGSALAFIRARTESIVPGMIVHGAFNAIALLAVLGS